MANNGGGTRTLIYESVKLEGGERLVYSMYLYR